MQQKFLNFLKCPVTRGDLELQIIKKSIKILDGINCEVIDEGILFGENEWFYPIIDGIPRLIVEGFLDYQKFLELHLKDYQKRKEAILLKHKYFLNYILKKNKKTKKSFTTEWNVFDYEKDTTWGMDGQDLVKRFCEETDETISNLQNKFVLDAGCGNAKLNMLLAKEGVENVAMDFSQSIVNANKINKSAKVHFVQADVQFPPFKFNCFDLVHCSGVLIATNNSELSFSCLETTVKVGGKFSVWLYHQRENFIHNTFNFLREYTSKLPIFLQHLFYNLILLPVSFIVKRIKGNKQNINEMRIDILDWFTPQYRWEHGHTEAAAWYYKRKYSNVKVTTNEMFGFDIIGTKL
jgi:ubiquinone/menaquinone biosynthesis C-methylase UbiE/uncharacterized protein YbaR (Trm112 family)